MTHDKKVVAIIQARMSSSRLPGKIMLDLAGKPVLWHVFHRLKKSKTITQIVLATTTDSCDDELEDYAHQHGIEVVRGSRDNVLARFVIAVDKFNPDYLIRITSDCPMLDAKIIDNLTDALIEQQGDFAGWAPEAITLHGGFEPVSRRLFDRIVKEGADHPVAQEHVIGYLSVNPNLGTFVGIQAPIQHVFEHARLWLDTPADLKLLRTLYDLTGAAPGDIEMDDVATLFRNDPGLQAINSHVRQKEPYEVSRKVIFRCDGDASIGLGHIVRMIALATELRERYATAVTFAIMHGQDGINIIKDAQLPFVLAPPNADEATWLDALIHDIDPHAIVFDIRTDLPGTALDTWRKSGVFCVLIDDIGPRLAHADLSFCPPTPNTLALSQENLKAGWAWLILRPPFSKTFKRHHHDCPHILISCGASDPAGFTTRAIHVLNQVTTPLHIDVVQGPLLMDRGKMLQAVQQSRHDATIHVAPQDMAALMAHADLGIISFGVTAQEAAAVGMPSLYLCLSEDHAASASLYDDVGLGVNLGVFTAADEPKLLSAVRRLLKAPGWLSSLPKIIDGQGAQRIAKIIADKIQAGRKNMP